MGSRELVLKLCGQRHLKGDGHFAAQRSLGSGLGPLADKIFRIGHLADLNDLMLMGLNHAREGKGMAFIEVLSPCVTYNDTYPKWMNKVYDLDSDADYQNGDRGKAFFDIDRLLQQSHIPIGLVYHGEHASLQSSLVSDPTPFHALDQQHSERIDQHLQEVLTAYAV